MFQIKTINTMYIITNFKKYLVFSLFICVFQSSFAQEGNEFCFHIETKNGTSKFLNYLFKKYGVEHSEKILMNVKSYEATNEVFVFYKTDYFLITEKIELLIQQSNDAVAVEHLNLRKSKIVLFDTIESIVNH